VEPAGRGKRRKGDIGRRCNVTEIRVVAGVGFEPYDSLGYESVTCCKEKTSLGTAGSQKELFGARRKAYRGAKVGLAFLAGFSRFFVGLTRFLASSNLWVGNPKGVKGLPSSCAFQQDNLSVALGQNWSRGSGLLHSSVDGFNQPLVVEWIHRTPLLEFQICGALLDISPIV
jgi:hypothetical protein